MSLFKRRAAPSAPSRSSVAFWVGGQGCGVPSGYHKLMDCPEVAGLINRMASIIGSSTIYLMANTPDGDKRLHDRLAHKVDIDPWRMGTRQAWMSWIVTTLLSAGDGNALVLPHYTDQGLLYDLEPMPGAQLVPLGTDRRDYEVRWQQRTYARDTVLHFRLFADPETPWRGRGLRASAQDLADVLGGLSDLEKNLSAPDWKPPMIVYADVDSDLFSDEKRADFRRKYLEDAERGQPWIVPADVVKVDKFAPLSLTDLAIKDTAELNRTALATLFGAPPFLLGVGNYNREQYNSWIKTAILPICQGITQTLTQGLLDSPDRYFVMPEKRLYAYTPMEMVTMALAMSDRGYVNGDEVRDLAMMDPAGLTDFRALENYIPYDMAALQAKLQGGADNA